MAGSEGSTVRMRACTAGYAPGCAASAPMSEVVASGFKTGDETLASWVSDPTSGPIVTDAQLIVVGVGRSKGATGYIWTMDLGSVADASCNGP